MDHSESSEEQVDTTSVHDPTVGYLDFFHRWDTPLDDDASRMFSRLVRQSPDFETFRSLAPAGSEARALFARHLASFEDAADLIQDGRMREDLFFDAWNAMPQTWLRSRPFVLGMRNEIGNLTLYQRTEWVASRAEQYWSAREKSPPKWKPIDYVDPTPADRAIFAAFQQIWSTPRDEVGRAFFIELQGRATDFESFAQIVQPGSVEYIMFDRTMCAYDQAGALMKNGILHPALFFNQWRSPNDVWRHAEAWVKGLRRTRNSPHICENVDWLVEYELGWRARLPK